MKQFQQDGAQDLLQIRNYLNFDYRKMELLLACLDLHTNPIYFL